MEKNKNSNNQLEKIKEKFKKIEDEINDNSLSKEQLLEWFKEEITRKDEIIQKLKKDNKILFNTAIRSNNREFEKITSSNYDENNQTKSKKEEK